MPCIWLGHIGEYRLRPLRLGANTNLLHRPAASRDQDCIGPQSLRTYSPIFPCQMHGIPQLYMLSHIQVSEPQNYIFKICVVWPEQAGFKVG